MKKIILTGIGFCLALSLTFAQQILPEQIAANATTELVQKLNLSDEQKIAVSSILLDQTQTEASVLKDSTSTVVVKSQILNKLQTEVDNKIIQVLKEDQKVIYQEIIAQRPEKTASTVIDPAKKDSIPNK